MAFTKITNQELNSRGATTLPNQPKISATALKQEFDAPAKNIVAPKFNNLIDELEATTAAASLGAVAPSGQTGETVQDVIDSMAAETHTHANKALLDTYTQTEEDLASAVADDHTHENKALLDSYTQSNDTLVDTVSKAHTHDNKTTLDKFSESGGIPYYDGNPIGGGGQGYMPVAVYDSNGDVATAGGIPSYAMKVDGSNAAREVTFANSNIVIGSRSGQADRTPSLVVGNSNLANWHNCVAVGSSTRALNTSAFAEGYSTTASGMDSHAAGEYTNAGYTAQMVIGKYNDNQATTLFEVGNGTSTSARSNAFEVYSNGNVNVQGQILRNGAPEYLENDSVTLSTSGTTTVTFTNAAITTDSVIDCYCTQYGLNPDDITVTTGSCVVTMPQVDTAVTVGVRIYLK